MCVLRIRINLLSLFHILIFMHVHIVFFTVGEMKAMKTHDCQSVMQCASAFCVYM